jgi:hypothetical protein
VSSGLRHGHAWREDPVDAARVALSGGHRGELLHQFHIERAAAIAHAAEANVVRVERGVLQVALAVYRVVSDEEGHSGFRVPRGALKHVVCAHARLRGK